MTLWLARLRLWWHCFTETYHEGLTCYNSAGEITELGCATCKQCYYVMSVK